MHFTCGWKQYVFRKVGMNLHVYMCYDSKKNIDVFTAARTSNVCYTCFPPVPRFTSETTRLVIV